MNELKEPSSALMERPSPTADFLTFGKPDISLAEIEAVVAVLKSGWLSTGPVVRAFEKVFENFIGEGYAVAVASCTEALRLSLAVSKVGFGDEVITTPLTFSATVNAIMAVGAKPVFVDVTPAGQIDPALIEAKITSRTKAIIPVHYTGAPADLDPINELATLFNLAVIEDAAHAFDAWYGERRIGTVSPFTCFSFYATKNITCGEGGMVMCRNKDQADQIRTLSMQGLSSGAWNRYGSGPINSYQVAYAGYKGNLSDIHAAIGLAQLIRWPALKTKRDAIWAIYEKAFGPKEPGHGKHLFTVRSARRDALRQFLYASGIGTGIHFQPLHLEPAYIFLGHQSCDFPNAEIIGRETLSLPISTTMTKDDAERVVNAVRAFDKTGKP